MWCLETEMMSQVVRTRFWEVKTASKEPEIT